MPLLKTESISPDSDECDERGAGGLLCLVCGDTATGRHYGSVACNGCKGFFRRTIRRNYRYTCRFNSNCQIDKHNRAVCRACRYMRCIKFGMKVDAVQNERDLIGKRPRTHSSNAVGGPQSPPGIIATSPSLSQTNPFAAEQAITSNLTSNSNDPWENPKALVELLLKSEEKEKNLRASVIMECGKLEFTTKNAPHFQTSLNHRKATHNDILHSLHSQLLLVIEWAKTLKPFGGLSTEDQTALLKNFASQHIVLCVAYRSINACDMLQLINDTCIPRASGRGGEVDDFYSKDCDRVMDTLVAPMRFLQMDDVEFVSLKACVLFDPVAKGLSNESVMKVLDTRRKIFAALEHYTRQKLPADNHRIGDLTFFILSPLQSLAKSISEDILVSKLSGMARIDLLMEELILEEPKQRNPLNLPRSTSETEDPQFADLQQLGPTCSTSAASDPTLSQGPYDDPMAYSTSTVGSAPATSDLNADLKYSTIPAMNDEMSPINQYEMMSTLSSYVFGGTLQSPLSPSNDVMFSSAASNGADAVEAKNRMDEEAPCVQQVMTPIQQSWPTAVSHAGPSSMPAARPSTRIAAHLQSGMRPNYPTRRSSSSVYVPQAGLNF